MHFQNGLTLDKSTLIFSDVTSASVSVPADRRSFRTGLKKILEDRSVQDLKLPKGPLRTSLLIQELLLGFSKWLPWNFNAKPS